MSMNMNIQTARYVAASELFKDFADIKRYIEQGSDFDFSWQEKLFLFNNHSLIDYDCLLDALDSRIDCTVDSKIEPETRPEGMSAETEKEVFLPAITVERWETFRHHVRQLPDDVYIDLES